METSLIGKAVGFGSKEYGFEPRVSNMIRYNSNAYVTNHVNLLITNKKGKIKMVLTRKTYSLLKALHKVGCINRFLVTRSTFKGVDKRHVIMSALFYKNVPFFSNVRLVSTPSKRHTVSLRALRVISQSLRTSVLILSTSHGLLDHNEAIQRSTGGLIVAVVS